MFEPHAERAGRSGPDPRRVLGAAGEQYAVEHLERRGLAIVTRNFRTRWGEIDIVACDARAIVFVEVKTRRASEHWRDPLESITPHKRRQVRRMAGQWLALRPPGLHRGSCRFDAVGVTLDARGRLLRLDHVEGAF